jgi:Spy/CpxP family protein refolding chaperone
MGKARRIARITILLGALGAVIVLAWATLAFAAPANQAGRGRLRAGQNLAQAGGAGAVRAGQASQTGQAGLAGRARQRLGQGQAAGAAPGAGSGAGQETGLQKMKQLAGELGLTPEQRQSIRTTLQAHREEIRNLVDKMQQTRQTLRQAAEAQPPDEKAVSAAGAELGTLLANGAMLRAQVAGEVKCQLTPEQVQMWEQWRTSHPQGPGQRLLGGAGASEKAK